MEKIVKQFKINKILIPTNILISGGTTEYYHNFIIDSGATYNLKFSLESNNVDLGLFNIDDVDNPISLTGNNITITGTSNSRLSELEKYVVSSDINTKYRLSTNNSVDGVNNVLSSGDTVIYYINGVTYIDKIIDNIPITTTSTPTHNFDKNIDDEYINIQNKLVFKYPQFENVVSKPMVDQDINIERPNFNVLEKNYRLGDINNISDLINYVAGSYFNIVDNF